MINRMLFLFLMQWRKRAVIRQELKQLNAWTERLLKAGQKGYRPLRLYRVPGWGIFASLARRVLFLFFFLRFPDLTWRQYRRLVTDPESVQSAGQFWNAHQFGFRTYREYDFSQWLQSRNPAKYPALPQGIPVLALPEGRETALEREIELIQKESHHGCGLYYEIYEPRVLRALRNLRNRLNDYDREVFSRLLAVFGWDISDESFAASARAEAELMEELYGE